MRAWAQRAVMNRPGMNKDELIETIEVKHRQLARYLFYFEKDSGGVFVASDRFKFGHREALQPGVFMDWSLKDVLVHLIDWEQRFQDWYADGLAGRMPSDLPAAEFAWDRFDASEFPLPMELRARPIQQVLADFKDSFEGVLSTAAALTEEALFSPGAFAWTAEACLADYLALCTYRHYDWAKRQIRRWRARHAGAFLNKESLLERIHTERRRLQQNLDTLAPEQLGKAGVIGHWTVKDILAHLVDWEQRLIGWYQAGLRGEQPEVPAPGLTWAELDRLNERIYQEYRHRPLDDILQAFATSYRQVLQMADGIPEDDLFVPGRYDWLGEENLSGFILANTANHYRWAKQAIRNWLKSTAG